MSGAHWVDSLIQEFDGLKGRALREKARAYNLQPQDIYNMRVTIRRLRTATPPTPLTGSDIVEQTWRVDQGQAEILVRASKCWFDKDRERQRLIIGMLETLANAFAGLKRI